MLSYDRFWKLLRERGISQYQLIHSYHISPDRLLALRQNRYVRTSFIAALCQILCCRPDELFASLPKESGSDTVATEGGGCAGKTVGKQAEKTNVTCTAAPAQPGTLSYMPLFQALQCRGRSLAELRQAALIDRRTLQRLHQNRPISLYTLERIGAFLDCGPEHLFSVALPSTADPAASPL